MDQLQDFLKSHTTMPYGFDSGDWGNVCSAVRDLAKRFNNAFPISERHIKLVSDHYNILYGVVDEAYRAYVTGYEIGYVKSVTETN